MLVLSRKEAERIRLGDSIVITVVRIGGDKVRIGIEAPKEMLVLRDELEAYDKGPKRPSGRALVELEAGLTASKQPAEKVLPARQPRCPTPLRAPPSWDSRCKECGMLGPPSQQGCRCWIEL